MKKLLLFLFCLNNLNALSQQKPYYTQYIMNNYILNPAISGIENYTDVKLSYRNQWTDIEGAPKTMYLSIQAPIGKQDSRNNVNSVVLPGENPLGKAYWQNYTAAKPHGGVGLIVMNDKTGYLSRGSVYGTVAYHIGIGPKTTVSAGFLGGLSRLSLDRSQIKWATLDPNDPAIGFNENLNKTKPEVGAGIWVYSANYFLGASVLNIVPGKVSFSNQGDYGSHYEPQFISTAGIRVQVNEDVSALPSVMVQYVKMFPIQIHYNVKMQYQDKGFVGASYRSTDALGGFAAMVGLYINGTSSISYSYDVAGRSNYRTSTGSTHEFVLGFLLANKDGVACPKNIW